MHLQKPGKIVRKKYLWCLIIVVVFFLFPQVFASGDATRSSNELVSKFLDALYLVLDLSSRLWIVLGNIAWKLMTNVFVYWEFINLDTYLWQIRQLVRTFVNFGIWFLFFYYIFSYIINSYRWKGEVNIKKNIVNLLVASVLVQMSRFLVMVIVDVSTILMATVSALPSQMIANNSSLKDKFEIQLRTNSVFRSAYEDTVVKLEKMNKEGDKLNLSIVPIGEGSNRISEEELIDSILPSPKNLSGPLMYLWFVILEGQELNVFYDEKKGRSSFDALMKELLIITINAGMIILYTVALLLLIFVNIVRVAVIRLLVVSSPILVLLKVVGGKIKWADEAMKLLDLKTLLNMVFKPVLFALMISVAMIVLILFKDLSSRSALNFSGLEVYHQEVSTEDPKHIQETVSGIEVKDMFNIIFYQWQKTLSDILMAFLALFLIWTLIKVAISSKTGIKMVDDMTESAVKLVDSTLGSIRVIPTPAGTIGFGWLWHLKDSYQRNGPIGKYLEKRTMEDNKRVRGMMGLDEEIDRTRSNKTKTHISSLTKNPDGNINWFGAFTASLQKDYNGFYFEDIATPLMDWINQGNRRSGSLTAIWINDSLKNDLKNKKDPKKFYDHLLSNLSPSRKEFFEKVLKLSWDTNHLISYDQLKGLKVDKEGNFRTS